MNSNKMPLVHSLLIVHGISPRKGDRKGFIIPYRNIFYALENFTLRG